MKRPSLAALAAIALAAVASPAAHADPIRSHVEPIVIVAGGQSDCDVAYSDGYGSWFNQIAADPAGSWRVPALTPESSAGANDGQVYVWKSNETGVPADQLYKLCQWDTSVQKLGSNLYRRLLARTTNPADTGFYGKKVDLVGSSVGAVIARWCISKVTGCAALVDDFVGVVPANYGTTLATEDSCPYLTVFGTSYHLCTGLDTNGDEIQQLGGLPVASTTWDGKWLANGVDDSPGSIEYTNFFSSTDGVIQPYQRARLIDGAYNVRVYKPSQQLNHGTVIDSGLCPGSPSPDRWIASATVEWAAYFAMDAAPAPSTVTSTSSGPDGIMNCYYGPDRDNVTTVAPHPLRPVDSLPADPLSPPLP